MNILINCISLTNNNDPIPYNDGRFFAKQSNEACCKYLMRRGPRPDYIISIVTQQANLQGSYHVFQEAILADCREHGWNAPKFEKVKLSRSAERTNHFGAAISQVQKLILAEDLSDSKRILIDTAGGPRNISVMIQAMTKLLRYRGFQIDSFYTNLSEHRVFHDHTERQMEIMEAVAEFAQHGTVRLLRRFFENSRCKQYEEIRDLLDAMTAFSDSIQLCNTERLPETVEKQIFPALDRIDAISGTNREEIAALQLMTDYIRMRFGWNPLRPKDTVYTITLIEWCIENGYIQQAITLYTDSLPKCLLDTGFIASDLMLEDAEIKRNMNSTECTVLYQCLLDEPMNHVFRTKKELLQKALDDPTNAIEEDTDVRNIQIAFRKLRDIVGTKNPRDVLKSYKNKSSSQIEKEMRNFILKNGYTSMEKVKNGILSNDQKMRELLNLPEPEDEIQRKKQGASSFDIENVRKVYPDFQIRMSEDQTENFRNFLKSYVHIKKDVRNSVNHASADTKVQKLTPENIIKDLRSGLDALKKCMGR